MLCENKVPWPINTGKTSHSVFVIKNSQGTFVFQTQIEVLE